MQLRGTSDGRDDGSSEPVEATTEKFEEAQVSEDLELLADFVGYVGVFEMKFGQVVGVRVHLSFKGARSFRRGRA